MSVEVPIQGAVEAAETIVSAAAYASEQPSASITTGEGLDGQSSLHRAQPAPNGDSMHCGDAGSSQSTTVAGTSLLISTADDNPSTPPSDSAPLMRPLSPPSLLDTSSSDLQANSGPPPPSSKAIGKSPMHALPPTASASSTSAEEGSSSEQYQSGQPRKVLHIFSGAADRIDGFAAMMLDLYDLSLIHI